MCAEIVNLRLARKRRERRTQEEEAARNRVSHGESKASREERGLRAAKAARDLEAHRREKAEQASARAGETGSPEDRN
jgi:hypothetical protein